MTHGLLVATASLWLSCSPQSSEYAHAVELADRGRTREALQLFEGLTWTDRGVCHWIGYCLMHEGDPVRALTAFQPDGPLEYVADCYQALGMHGEDIAVRSRLLDDDPASLYNLAAAYRDMLDDAPPVERHAFGWDRRPAALRARRVVESLMREAASRMAPGDEGLPIVLTVLAEECELRGDQDQARRLRLQAEDGS